MADLYSIIERPLITEKALMINNQRRYAFVVNLKANKFEIKDAVQKLFTQPDGAPIVVTDVNTMRVKGKEKRFRAFGRYTTGKATDYKKAIVTLAEGQTLQIFEGV